MFFFRSRSERVHMWIPCSKKWEYYRQLSLLDFRRVDNQSTFIFIDGYLTMIIHPLYVPPGRLKMTSAFVLGITDVRCKTKLRIKSCR
ncbi:hypothetical protein ABKN59_008010 [Abortiporus biennis]